MSRFIPPLNARATALTTVLALTAAAAPPLGGCGFYANAPPQATLTRPRSGAVFDEFDPVCFEASAQDDDPGPDGLDLEFVLDASANLYGYPEEDASGNLTLEYCSYSLDVGKYEVRAVATDGYGATGRSAAVSFVVEEYRFGGTEDEAGDTTVRIVSPADGAVFRAPLSLCFEVEARSEPGGYVAYMAVDITPYESANGLEEETSPGVYTLEACGYFSEPGVYSVTAKTLDIYGARAESAPISVVLRP